VTDIAATTGNPVPFMPSTLVTERSYYNDMIDNDRVPGG